MTMLARPAVLALLALGAAGLPLVAGTARAASDGAPPRFTLAPVEGGALKLDTQTGHISLCTRDGAGFTCVAVPDTRDAYEAEIARLQAEIATLKQAGTTPGATRPGETPPAPGTPPQAAPDPSQIDRAFDYASQIYRRLRQMIDELRAPDQSETL
ncbi:hypothetical protein [Xanthobacter agilis]|uniref:hypothetical protein n=1 Tax=Xanthobacter agilis TaxID=47492 RepID=UPI00372C1E8D